MKLGRLLLNILLCTVMGLMVLAIAYAVGGAW